MHTYNVFYSTLILVPTITFVIAVCIKAFTIKSKTGKWSIAKALWSWGMPSVHASVVVSLSTAIVIKNWIQSDLFAITMTYTWIIIYDAINVRFESGLHAKAINSALWEKKFKESLGHLPSEAFAGSLLGIVVAVVLYYV